MANRPVPPFFARNRGPHAQIDNDFPQSARTALLHLLFQLVDKSYTEWIALARELERIARVRPSSYDESRIADIARARQLIEEKLTQLPWEKVLDFCERLYNHLAREVAYWDEDGEVRTTITSLADVRKHIESEIIGLLQEEHLAFEFSDGVIRRRGRRHTAETTSRAELVLGDPRLTAAREHFNKALR